MQKDCFFNNEANWNPIFGMELETKGPELQCSSEQYPSCYLNNNWDNSLDQSDPFESALSSIVSSPVNSHSGIIYSGGYGGENMVLKELIGRLGSISGSREMSPQSCIIGNNSNNTSCYNTPLNSPPKLNLSILEHGNLIPRNHQFPPEFLHMVESGKMSRVSSNQSLKTNELPIPIPASEQNKNLESGIKGQSNYSNGRKRKLFPKGNGIETHSSILSAKESKAAEEQEKDVTDAKRSKSNEEMNGVEKSKEEGNKKQTKENVKPEPPKDYIHVRARRGQATDSHSLAERVRREKISERMKFLQDLVPGCNKVTGKAVMLDEIINYVQSLQRQVEFLSMKLATINPRTDMSMEAVLCKDTRVSMLINTMNQVDALNQPFYVMAHSGPQNPLTSTMHRVSNMKSSQISGFSEASTFWENDLQSVVQTGISQNHGPSFHGTMGTGQMKVER